MSITAQWAIFGAVSIGMFFAGMFWRLLASRADLMAKAREVAQDPLIEQMVREGIERNTKNDASLKSLAVLTQK